jgi:hypothetical protein
MATTTRATHPLARSDVVLRRVGSEWVLFDTRRDRAHVLNLTAALVWTYCDGSFDTADMARAIAREVAGAPYEQIRGDIDRTLQRFASEGLLQ